MDLKKKLKLLYVRVPTFLKKLIYSIYSNVMKLLSPIIILKMNKGKFLNKDIKEINNINDAIELAFSFQYLTFSIKTFQVKYEITKLLKILKDLNPKIVLEIGTAGGGTFFLFTKMANPEATIISVDLPGGYFGGGYAKWKIPLYQSFAKRRQKIHLVRANSHNPNTFELVKNILDGRMVDFLFIDGDHTYEGVKRDFNIYSSLVKEGGIVAFHDIVKHPHESSCTVDKFWNEIKIDNESIEIIEDTNRNWGGIGVIYL